MGNPVPHSRARLMITSTLAAATLCVLPAGPAFAAEQNPADAPAAAVLAAPADPAAATAALAATPWETTSAVDQTGAPVALDDPRAANFVGNAYFKTDGTFTMFNLDDTPKMHGDWEMRVDNGQLVRWIQAKNDAGAVLFERVVPIVDLDDSVFTYRVVDAADPSQWVDIVHTPTDHAEPGTIDLVAATAALAATPWETTGAVDQTGAPVALDDPRAANFVGNAYFKTDGTFTMFNLDDTPKMHGDWEMRVENGQLVRWIQARDDAGNPTFTRTVPIVDLTGDVFTYRVVNAADPSQWVDIVHTPTDHAEPGAQQPGTEQPGTGGPGTEQPGSGGTPGETPATPGTPDAPGQPGDAPAAQGPDSLAVTGGATPAAALAASVIALLSGAVLFAARLLRRRLG